MKNLTTNSLGCMDFLLKTKDGNLIDGRTNEFAQNLDYVVTANPRGEEKQSTAPNNTQGLKWKSKYGYVATEVQGIDAALDGINEQGLTFGYLWLPETKYELEMATEHPEQAISDNLFGNWILGNFATIEEVKQALNNVYVYGEEMPALKGTPPLHVILHDATGKSLVIEFINGKKKIYDNELGILTNSPTFDWHLTNLRNYVNLRPGNVNPANYGTLTIEPTGQGSGLLGLPGDITPSSRFIRLAFYTNYVKKPENLEEGMNTTKHILNAFDIPLGVTRLDEEDDSKGDFTIYSVIKDLTNKKFYFRSYRNINFKMIDLSKINFDAPKPITVPVDIEDVIPDMTAQMK